MKLRRAMDTKLNVQISPLIDVVFLLLIYFMVTASLIKKEGDIAFSLPGGDPVIDLPVEVLVAIGADGSVELDGIHFSSDDKSLDGMVAHVRRLKKIAVSQKAEFFVNLFPHRDTWHGRIIDVMDACSTAGVEKLGFSRSI